jgi:hypothetical protein
MAAGGPHPGILVVRFDHDPRHDPTDRGIAGAIGKRDASGVAMVDQIHEPNRWR